MIVTKHLLFLLLLLFLFFLLLRSSALGEEVTSVHFQQDGLPSRHSHVTYNDSLPDLTAATVCFRVRLVQYRKVVPFLSYAVEGNGDELFIGYHALSHEVQVACCGGLVEVFTPTQDPQLHLGQWASLCVVLDLAGRQVVVYHAVNSSLQQSVMQEGVGEEAEVRGGGRLVVGQRQAVVDGGFSTAFSLRGQLADLRLFDTVLTQDEVLSFVTCQAAEGVAAAPLVSFAALQDAFRVGEAEVGSLQVQDACMDAAWQLVVISHPVTFHDAQSLCGLLGQPADRALVTPASMDEQDALLAGVAPYEDSCLSGNTSLGDLWVDGMALGTDSFHNFVEEVTMIDSGTCVSVSVWGDTRGLWHHTDCRDLKCAACRAPRPSVWWLRGHDTLLDHGFSLLTGNLSAMTGFFGSSLTLEEGGSAGLGQWRVASAAHPHVSAVLPRTSLTHYPFGVHEWRLRTATLATVNASLLLTRCGQDQLTCRDGRCIQRDYRCDLEVDCSDSSDEQDCGRVRKAAGYKREVSPPRAVGSGAQRVGVRADVLAVTKLDIAGFRVTVELRLELTWRDSRLTFLNLQQDTWKNKLSGGDLWRPAVEYLSSDGSASDLRHRGHNLYALHHQGAARDSFTDTLEDAIYQGNETKLKMVAQEEVTFSCPFDLFAFPFDEQQCDLIVALLELPRTDVTLTPQKVAVNFTGQRTMLHYYLDDEQADVVLLENRSAFRLRFRFINLSSYFIPSTYVPTFLLLVVGYLTFFFPLDDFSDRIMSTLTSLLVEAAFFTQVSASIPQTSYLKLVDMWFVFCIIFLFVVMLALVAVNSLQPEENTDTTVEDIRCEEPFYMRFNLKVNPEPLPNQQSHAREGGICCCAGKQKRIKKRTRAEVLNLTFRIVLPILLILFLILYFCSVMIFPAPMKEEVEVVEEVEGEEMEEEYGMEEEESGSGEHEGYEGSEDGEGGGGVLEEDGEGVVEEEEGGI
ncbi:uncharacterized protein LOC135092906 [Scylla paramamosain]|uniref:uncharacterized protein LOC135092906 n=1 Tax=Scylla paramamosain TaxID=85552 RepID=UPI003083BAC6